MQYILILWQAEETFSTSRKISTCSNETKALHEGPTQETHDSLYTGIYYNFLKTNISGNPLEN